MLLVLMISLTTLTFTASQQDFVTFRVTLDEDTTMLISPSPDDQERLSGAADGAGLPNEMSPLTSDKHEGASLLWLPYVALTLFLISLLLASFIHFHIKYRDRYVQRDKLRKEIARPAEPDDIEAAAAAATAAAGAAMFNHLPLSATRLLANRAGLSGSNNMPEESALPRQKTRLKMLYDNKVDVSSIVENSLLGRRGSAGDIPQSTSDDVTSDHLVPFNDADHDRKYKGTSERREGVQVIMKILILLTGYQNDMELNESGCLMLQYITFTMYIHE